MYAWTRGTSLWTLVAIAGTCAGAQPPAAPPATTPAVPAVPTGAAPATPVQPQPSAPATPTAAPAVDARAHAAIQNQVADWLTRVAMVDLRVNPVPHERDYDIASTMLREAHAMRPDDLTILRLAVDAATQAGDADRAIELTRELVRADPGDTRAQLSLIATRVNKQQTIEGRLEMLRRFLGPDGAAIDPSIRSRLALDAAMLCRERGDGSGFVKLLTEATALDSTNKDAAALAYTYFSQRVSEDAGQFELLVNLLKADPLDSDTRVAMGRLLAHAGAHAGARRFFTSAIAVLKANRSEPDIRLRADMLRQNWILDGSEAVIEFLTNQIAAPRRELQELIDDAKLRGAPTDQIPDPANYRIAPDLEQVRCLAAYAIDDPEYVDQSLAELGGSIVMYAQWVQGTMRRPDTVSLERAAQELELWAPEVLWVHLWVGRKLEGIEAQIEAFQKAGQLSGARLDRMNAFLKLRRGDLDGARTALEAMTDDPQARMGLGILSEIKGDKDGAIAQFKQIATDASGTLTGTWCAMRVAHLTGTVPTPPQAATLQAMADGVPLLFDNLIDSPRLLMAMFLDVPQRTVGPTDRAMLRVRLVNRSPIPLAVGAERPINSRILLSAETDIAGVRSYADSAPEVLSLDRRLRLLPREEIDTLIWADSGFGGWSLGYGTGESVQRRFRALQGFVLNDQAIPVRGGMSLEADSVPVTRNQLPYLRATDDQLVELLGALKGEQFAAVLHVARLRLLSSGLPDGTLPAQAGRIADAILNRYRAEDRLGRLFILVATPTGLQNAVAADLDRGIRDTPDVDPMVLLLKAVTRVTDATDPTLAAAKACPQPDVSRAAGYLEQRLAEPGARGYAKMTTFRTSGTGPLDP